MKYLVGDKIQLILPITTFQGVITSLFPEANVYLIECLISRENYLELELHFQTMFDKSDVKTVEYVENITGYVPLFLNYLESRDLYNNLGLSKGKYYITVSEDRIISDLDNIIGNIKKEIGL